MKQVGRPRILNDDRVPDDHVCHKCKKDNTEVGFQVCINYISRMCNYCSNRNKTVPRYIRQIEIAKRINDYQKKM